MRTPCEVDEVMSGLLKDAMAYHGDLGLSPAAWQMRVAAIVTKCGKEMDDARAAMFASRLHTRDLYLATCCAEGLDSAWRRFDTLYHKYVQELARCLTRNALQAEDIGEGLLVDLFLPDTTGHSRIASYDGRSSLATWLHVIVMHRIANERVRKWNTLERPGDVPEIADRSALGNLDAAIRAARYGPAIEASLRKAIAALTARERQMLLWRYQRGLLLEDIGRMLSVHPSTVFRQLERAQERLREHVALNLARTYGFAEAAISECFVEALENGSARVSLLRMIGGESTGAGSDRRTDDRPVRQIA
jgi:RNA polymerase sigma-70 factor